MGEDENTQGVGQESELFKMAASTVSASLNPQEKAQLPSDFAAQAKIKKEAAEGMDSRTQVYNALMNKNSLIDQKQAELLNQMSTNKPLSKSQVAAMMLIGIMPTLVGGIVNGKRGISQGATAATLGVETANKGFQAQNKQDAEQAQLEYKSLDKTKQANNNQANDLLADEFKSKDMNARTDANNATKLQAASIRASGDVAIGRELAAVSKAMDVNKKAADAAARIKPVRLGDKLYTSSGSVRDKDVDEIRDISADFQIADRNLKKMYQLTKSMDAGAIERLWTDKNSELNLRREDLLTSLNRINEIPGRGGEYLVKKIQDSVADPRSFYQNLVAAMPGKTGLPESLEISSKLLRERGDSLLKSRGVDISIPIGEKKMINGKIHYVKGMDNEGNVLLTDDPIEIDAILQGE